jgi:hypothetical protein
MIMESPFTHPYVGINGLYLSKEQLDAVREEIAKRVMMWTVGIDTPNECEKLAFLVLKFAVESVGGRNDY